MRPDDPALTAVRETDHARREASRPPAPYFPVGDCHGPIGDYVRLWAPHTEASVAAMYAVALAACGSLIGRGPTWAFGGTEHHARLFVTLIGPSGAGRKGTAIGPGLRILLRELDEGFARDKVSSGLSSAEGLIHEVRDPWESPDGKRSDPGVLDKRLCIVEEELGGVLEAMGREGNRLSAVLRDAWDGRSLRSMVKKDPQSATDPHITLVSAITPTELRKLLSKTAVHNGFANRLLPVWTKRERLMPEDQSPDPRDIEAVVRQLRSNIADTRRIGQVTWTSRASAMWKEVYNRLSVVEDASETLQSLLQRAAPYVRRIAMTLCLLDGQRQVDVNHLEAALRLWDYSAATWRFVFFDGIERSPLAAKILAGLKSAGPLGMSRSEIREDAVKSGNVPSEAIEAALRELDAVGLIFQQREPTKGRPTERWIAVEHVST